MMSRLVDTTEVLAALLALTLVVAMVVGPSFAKAKSPVVVMETSKGAITIELYPDKAPKTVENFLWYVDNEFYNGLIFHRVMDNFMIQGGGFTKDLVQKQPNPAIENEAHNALTNARGTIAMARTPDVNSATCQFFINLKDNDFLNHKDKTPRNYGYAVFGKVIDGMDVVDEIAKVKVVSKSGYENVPATPVVISKVYQSKKEHAKEADKSSKEKPKKEE